MDSRLVIISESQKFIRIEINGSVLFGAGPDVASAVKAQGLYRVSLVIIVRKGTEVVLAVFVFDSDGKTG